MVKSPSLIRINGLDDITIGPFGKRTKDDHWLFCAGNDTATRSLQFKIRIIETNERFAVRVIEKCFDH